MAAKIRRYEKLLDVIREELTERYQLNEIEQYYLFNNSGGTAEQRIETILKNRIITYQQQRRN